ncbi:unnamed protein product [Urochloa humidicola]
MVVETRSRALAHRRQQGGSHQRAPHDVLIQILRQLRCAAAAASAISRHLEAPSELSFLGVVHDGLEDALTQVALQKLSLQRRAM